MFEVVESEIVSNCETVEYNETSAALAMLAEKYATVVFDVSTKTGLEQAKSARSELRGYRTNLETLRKSIKAPALNRCRLIDEEAKSITEKLVALEKPIAQQIEAEEARKEAEKQAKLQVEIARVQNLRARIAVITQIADGVKPTSDACQQALVQVKSIEIGPDFEELQPDAQQAKDAALLRLQNLFAQYTASEAEAEQIRIDRAKLAQLEAESKARREQDDHLAAVERDRLRNEQEAQLVEERRRAAQIAEAEREAQATKNREIEAQQAEQRRQQDEQARLVREAQQAEQRRLDEQAAALRRQQDEADAAERQRAAEAALEASRHKDIEDAMKTIDAALFYGNTFHQYAERMKLREYLGRWNRWDRVRNYFAADGTLLNADGTRSIFDDVDQ